MQDQILHFYSDGDEVGRHIHKCKMPSALCTCRNYTNETYKASNSRRESGVGTDLRQNLIQMLLNHIQSNLYKLKQLNFLSIVMGDHFGFNKPRWPYDQYIEAKYGG